MQITRQDIVVEAGKAILDISLNSAEAQTAQQVGNVLAAWAATQIAQPWGAMVGIVIASYADQVARTDRGNGVVIYIHYIIGPTPTRLQATGIESVTILPI